MAANTMDQAAANWKMRLDNLAKKGLNHIIMQANAVIELEAPSYLGVYRDAVFIDQSDFPNSLSLMMTEASLLASAQSHSGEIAEFGFDVAKYVFGEATPNKVEDEGYTLIGSNSEPYPLRIEAIGSPKFDEGQNAWLHARKAAGAAMPAALRMATR